MNIMPKNSKSITKLSKYYLLEIKVFKTSKNSKPIIFKIIKHLFIFLDWYRIWKTCVNHTLAHMEIINKNCNSSIPQNKQKSAQLLSHPTVNIYN